MADIVIRNGYLLTMDPRRGDIDNGVLTVQNGLIREVGSSTAETAPTEIDASGCLVMPGLVNTHGHAAMTLLRGRADDLTLKEWLEDRIWPAESRMSPSDIRIGSLLGCLEMIRSGTTCFADMYFHSDETARAVEESGLRAALSYGMIDLDSRERADAELEEGTRFVREWNGRANGRITTMYAPHAPNTCSREFLERIIARAREDGAALHTHILETRAERDGMHRRYGTGSIRFLDDLGFFESHVLAAHCVWPGEGEIGILADRGVHVSHNPVSNLKLASGIAPVAEMLRAGVPVSLGTDGCASNNSLDMFEEMKMAALVQKTAENDPTVLPARQLLQMATVNGAKALGAESGILKPGFNADIIIVDLNRPHMTPLFDAASQLVYAARGSDVRTVIVAGRIVMLDRIVTTLDEQAILAAARDAAGGLHGRT